MFNLFRRKKEAKKKNIMIGDTCKVILENGPESVKKYIGREFKANYFDSRLLLRNEDHCLKSTPVINVKAPGSEILFKTENNSTYVIRQID